MNVTVMIFCVAISPFLAKAHHPDLWTKHVRPTVFSYLTQQLLHYLMQSCHASRIWTLEFPSAVQTLHLTYHLPGHCIAPPGRRTLTPAINRTFRAVYWTSPRLARAPSAHPPVLLCSHHCHGYHISRPQPLQPPLRLFSPL